MVSILIGNTITTRKNNESIDQHITRHKEDQQKYIFINNAVYDAQQKAIKEARK